MQAPPFPDKIDPWRLAAGNGRLEGELMLAAMPRLAAVSRAGGKASVSLVAGVDENGVHFMWMKTGCTSSRARSKPISKWTASAVWDRCACL